MNAHKIEPLKYYQLLDWKDRNPKDFKKVKGDVSLNSLSKQELLEMYTMLYENDMLNN
jgi:hypothetical protein